MSLAPQAAAEPRTAATGAVPHAFHVMAKPSGSTCNID